MFLQFLRHGGQRSEESREDALVGRGDRVRGIRKVEVDLAVIGIDHDLDRIADIIEFPIRNWLSVREIIARRIGVLHPEQPPFADDDVGIVVEAKERSNRPYPVLDGTAEHDATVAGNVAADQNVQVLEIPREQHSSSDPVHGDPARALVDSVDIVFAIRIVELRSAAFDDDVGIGLLPIVDAGLLDRRAARCDRRDVLQIEDRQPFGALARDRAHDRAIAVGEKHMTVDPRLGVGGHQRRLELAGRQHHRLIGAI